MLTLLAKHAAFDLSVERRRAICTSISITRSKTSASALGQALRQALGDKAGIRRYGHFTLPMEETLVTVGHRSERPLRLVFQVAFAAAKIGDFDSELVEDFWQAVGGQRADEPARDSAPRPQQPPHQRSDLQSHGPSIANGRRARPAHARRAEHEGTLV